MGGTTNRITSISGFVCNGTEPSLSACPMVSGAASTCSLAASVVCQLSDVARAGNCTHGDIRLVNGTSQINGRFEVCINNAWGTMCSGQVFSKEAAVVCRQLNASNPNIRVNAEGQYDSPQLLNVMNKGMASTIFINDYGNRSSWESMLIRSVVPFSITAAKRQLNLSCLARSFWFCRISHSRCSIWKGDWAHLLE